jgi:hypothetical protein
MLKGTVKSFDREKGFGVIVLETGEEIPFDISVSNKREFAIGAVADVTVGASYTGKPKAKLVLFELEEDRAPPFAVGIKQLQKLSFLTRWDPKQAKAAAREVFEAVPSRLLRAHVGDLFQHYYGEGLSDAGRGEGVMTLDWRFGNTTQRPAEDLLALCPEDPSIAVRSVGDRAIVSGEEVDLTSGLLPLLDAMNRALDARNVDGQFFSLSFDADFYGEKEVEWGAVAEVARRSLT